MRVSGKHNDLDNVGPSLRHHTFFEMLGNFSFGDYFKQDAIPFAWELLTARLEVCPPTGSSQRFSRAKRAFRAMTRRSDLDDARARRRASRARARRTTSGRWATPARADAARRSTTSAATIFPCPEPVCRGMTAVASATSRSGTTCSWSSTATAGTLTPLPAPSIDTGMGLERVTAVIQGKLANYDTDLFTPILERDRRTRRATYTHDVGTRRSPGHFDARVADHLRAMTFLIADGVLPSNEWRGYVLRKIMRRAMRHGKKLGFTEPFLHQLVDVVVGEMGDAYPELQSGHDAIARTVRARRSASTRC